MKMYKIRNSWRVLVGTALVTAMALSGHAQTNFWIAPGGGNLHDAENWSLGAPTMGQMLCFTNPASYAITNHTHFNLTVDTLFAASSGTVTYVGNSFRAQRAIYIGTVPGATATVDFVKGQIDAPYGYIYVGRDGGRGHMRMSGNMGRIYTYYDADIGTRSDDNMLEVRDGAYFYKTDNATTMRVGNNGSRNTLLIAAGGAVTNWSNFYVGCTGSDYSNRVIVTGIGSSLALDGSRNTQIGRYGYYNELIVTNGGQVYVRAGNTGLVIGQYGYNTRLLVSGRGSRLNCAGRLMLSGDYIRTGNRLDILDGGQAEMVTLEFTGANRCQVTVAGTGSLFRAVEARVGTSLHASANAATMSVSDGARAETELLTVGLGTAPASQVLVDNAALVATNASGTGRLEIRRGSVSLANGATLTADSLCITNTAATTCRLTATLGGTPAGVVLTQDDPESLDLQVPGGVQIVFAAEPAEVLKPLWGLQVPGDQVARLAGLLADGMITCDTTALSRVTRKRFGVHYDARADMSFIGVAKKVFGTYLLLR